MSHANLLSEILLNEQSLTYTRQRLDGVQTAVQHVDTSIKPAERLAIEEEAWDNVPMETGVYTGKPISRLTDLVADKIDRAHSNGDDDPVFRGLRIFGWHVVAVAGGAIIGALTANPVLGFAIGGAISSYAMATNIRPLSYGLAKLLTMGEVARQKQHPNAQIRYQMEVDAALNEFQATRTKPLGEISTLQDSLAARTDELEATLARQWEEERAAITGLTPDSIAEAQDLARCLRSARRQISSAAPMPPVMRDGAERAVIELEMRLNGNPHAGVMQPAVALASGKHPTIEDTLNNMSAILDAASRFQPRELGAGFNTAAGEAMPTDRSAANQSAAPAAPPALRA